MKHRVRFVSIIIVWINGVLLLFVEDIKNTFVTLVGWQRFLLVVLSFKVSCSRKARLI